MKTNYQAFVFDLDGTIVSTIEDIAIAGNYGLTHFNLKPYKTLDYLQFINYGSAEMIARAVGEEHKDLANEVFKVYYDYYIHHFAVKSHPYPGIIESLQYAKDKGIHLYVYTNKPQDISSSLIETLFPKNFFDKVVGIPLGGKTKPDPEPFIEAIKDKNYDFNKLAYFGDSNIDILTAENLKISSMYSVSWGYKTKEYLLNYKGHKKAVLDYPYQIKDVVDNTI